MRFRTIALAAGACLSLAATSAWAQGGIDPARLQLARRMIQSNGGVEGVRDQMKALLEGVGRIVKQTAPPGQEGLADAVARQMGEEQLKLVPALMDDMAIVYAEHLTSQEMNDAIAWNESPSGRSIRAKSPALSADLMQRQTPRLMQMSRDMVLRSIERACDENHCTAAQREQVLAAMARAMPQSD
jgi:hypothetical protein